MRRTGRGPELVWIHGLGESSTSFDPVIARMPGFTHVLCDLPGYGRSAWPDEPMGLPPRSRIISRDGSERRRLLIGHSMGGVLATLVAERGVARAIVDVDGNLSRGDCTFSARAIAYSEAEFSPCYRFQSASLSGARTR